MVPILNRVKVVLLQHPKEVNHPKGTANLLKHSLSNCQCFVGENFDQHEQFQQLLSSNSNIALLYPDESAAVLSETNATMPMAIDTLLVIDSTWKKSYKIYQLSTCLHAMCKVQLPQGLIGQYDIRTTKKENALSTLEATCYALGAIEQNQQHYQALLKSFVQFNQYQLSFRHTKG